MAHRETHGLRHSRIAGRSDLLATMFLVPCVALALIWRDNGAKWALLLTALLYRGVSGEGQHIDMAMFNAE